MEHAARILLRKSGVQEATRPFPPVTKEGRGTARFGSGALNANEYDGKVNVNRNDAENLSNPYDNEGGRCAEAVNEKTSLLRDVFYGSRPSRFRVFFRQVPSMRPISWSRSSR